MNVNWIGPTMLKYGTEGQKAKYLPQISAGEMLWCQGFSEPNSGSDLASLRTRAELEGDHYKVNGQKIWTSYAGLADTCFLLTRTSDDRKKGITILLVPMDTPGITVRQIPSLIGEGDIHEVFFDDVIVPVGQRFGEEGQAWEIIGYSLTNERLGIPRYHLAREALDRAVGILKAEGEFTRETVKAEAARCAALCEAARTAIYAIVQKRVDGLPIGGESSSARYATVQCERAVSEFVVEYVPEALAGQSAFLQMHHQRGRDRAKLFHRHDVEEAALDQFSVERVAGQRERDVVHRHRRIRPRQAVDEVEDLGLVFGQGQQHQRGSRGS